MSFSLWLLLAYGIHTVQFLWVLTVLTITYLRVLYRIYGLMSFISSEYSQVLHLKTLPLALPVLQTRVSLSSSNTARWFYHLWNNCIRRYNQCLWAYLSCLLFLLVLAQYVLFSCMTDNFCLCGRHIF